MNGGIELIIKPNYLGALNLGFLPCDKADHFDYEIDEECIADSE